jgi:uncharacterized UBP type Zn finger protein
MTKAEIISLKKYDIMKIKKNSSKNFEFYVENKYQCSISNQVKYSKIGLQTQSNIMELRIPLGNG